VYKRQIPAHVVYDDLYSAANFGLVNAARLIRTDFDRFRSFASTHIWWRVHDELEAYRPLPVVVDPEATYEVDFLGPVILDEALDALPLEDRVVAELHFYDGMSTRDLAAHLGVKRHRVLKQIKRTRVLWTCLLSRDHPIC